MSTDIVARPSRRLPRRSRAQARSDNRQALLEAARELIVEVGYSNAQLDQIADRAGLTKGAIYSIFGGKLELLRAVVEEHARQVMPLLDWQFDQPDTVTAEDLVAGLARNYVEFLDAHDTRQLLAFELDLAGLALRDAATLAVVLGHEQALAARLAGTLTGRVRRTGAPLDPASAGVAADLVLGALGGLAQRLVTATWMTRDADVLASAVSRLLPTAQTEPSDA
jgi:AcrR family transcriptional regulator